MSKTIVPNRLIIQTENDGSLKTAVLSYQIKDGDQLLTRPYSVSVKNALAVEQVQAIINAAITSAQESEGIQ